MFARALVPLCPKHTWRVFNENAGETRRGVHGEARIEMSEALCCGGAPTLQMLFVVDCEYWMHQAHYSYFKMNRLRWWFCTGLKCRSGILETRPKNHAWASEAGLVNPVLPWRPCTGHLVQTLTVTVSNVRNPGEGTDWSQSPLRIMSLLLFDYAKLLNLWAFSAFIAKMELNLGSSENEVRWWMQSNPAQGKARGRQWINGSYYSSTSDSIILRRIAKIFNMYEMDYLNVFDKKN